MSDPAVHVLRDACEGFDLAGLRRIVRWFLDANQETPDGAYVPDPNYPDEWIDHCINMVYFRLVQKQILAFEGDYYREMDFPINGGQRELRISGTVFKVDRVMFQWADTFWPLTYSNSAFAPDYKDTLSNWELLPSYYFKDANTLVFNPVPMSTGTVRVKWYEMPQRLCSDKDRPRPAVKYIWHYVIAAKAAVLAMTKTGDDSALVQQQAQEAMEELERALDRKALGPKFIQPWFGGYPSAHGGTSHG